LPIRGFGEHLVPPPHNSQRVFPGRASGADPIVALEQLIDLGFTRVMTSGGARTALAGADIICQPTERARDCIEILPAGGIAPANVRELVARTGCRQVHGSFRQRGSPYEATDLSAVAAVRELLDS
jgi:copper homeostasis protein CutC